MLALTVHLSPPSPPRSLLRIPPIAIRERGAAATGDERELLLGREEGLGIDDGIDDDDDALASAIGRLVFVADAF